MMSTWLQDAFIQAGTKMVDSALNQINEQISDELRKVLEMMKPEVTSGTSIHYNPFMEFGMQNVVDSTAVTIDDSVKVLPAPVLPDCEEK
jgi:hypothetical protein